MKILFIADVMGRPGRTVLKEKLVELREENNPDFVIINAENSAGGFGLNSRVRDELFRLDVDALTLGNHVWDKKEIIDLLEDSRIIRPLNYPEGVYGKGYSILKDHKGRKIGIINLLGRVFMQPLDCPFRSSMKAVEEIKKETNIIFVDIHAEATSEKVALGHYLDGKVSAVIGTHTHIPTADERVLPLGTAYITDAGMTGSSDSVIGVKKDVIINKYLFGLPAKYAMASESRIVEAVLIDVDDNTGNACSIKRIRKGDYYERK